MPGTGLLAAVVPGAFGGWLTLLAGWGTWSLADVLEPAIALADRGHPLLPTAAATINGSAERFRRDWPTSAELWLVDGAGPRAGRTAVPQSHAGADVRADRREAEAAGTDREVQHRGRPSSLVRGVRGRGDRPLLPRDHGGLLTGQDLADWAAARRGPGDSARYGDVTVAKTGPWGQGPVMLQQLALLEAAGLAEHEPGSASGST